MSTERANALPKVASRTFCAGERSEIFCFFFSASCAFSPSSWEVAAFSDLNEHRACERIAQGCEPDFLRRREIGDLLLLFLRFLRLFPFELGSGGFFRSE